MTLLAYLVSFVSFLAYAFGWGTGDYNAFGGGLAALALGEFLTAGGLDYVRGLTSE